MKFTAFVLSVVTAVAFSSCCCQRQAAPKLRNIPADLIPEEQPGQPGFPGDMPGQPGEPSQPGEPGQPGDANQPAGPVKVLDGVSK